MHRIVITGIGALTPIGNTFQASWQAACEQRSGIAPVTRFSTSGIPWKVCGELKHFDPAPYLSAKEARRLDPFAQYAVGAALMAAEDAGLIEQAKSGEQRAGDNDPRGRQNYLNSGGVIIGSSRGGIGTIEAALSSRPSVEKSPVVPVPHALDNHKHGILIYGSKTRSAGILPRRLKRLHIRHKCDR